MGEGTQGAPCLCLTEGGGVILGVPEGIGSEVEAWHSLKIVQLLNE